VTRASRVEDLLRDLAPAVLGALLRRSDDFAAAEDAVQEALIAAADRWPSAGIPDNPKGWLVTVATRRRIEAWRAEAARRRREEIAAGLHDALAARPDTDDAALERDDSLQLLLLCCHPALTTASQVALTLRAVGGLTTAEIGRAFLVPESTIAQRISRAKGRIRETGATFELPPADELPARIAAVLHVLYLVFNEGYTASSGPSLTRVDLTAEAIRLGRQLNAARPDDGEVAGLLALMLLTDARRPARVAADGRLVPLDEQDRARWDRAAIDEGLALISRALATAQIGPYQLQAAIAAVHAEARTAAETDWRQILVLYDLLGRLVPGPMVTLNRIVALAMVDGPGAGLEALDRVAADPALAGHHRVAAVRGHLLEQSGSTAEAAESYRLAARLTLSLPERRYLEGRAARLVRAR
jgi:RNA polymerase sigma factor (sigma-70 family)